MTDSTAVILRGARVWNGNECIPGDLAFVDGAITAVGKVDASVADRATLEIDVSGAAALPGFIDGHTHPLSWSRQLDKIDLAPARSIADIKEILSEACRNTPQGSWVEGAGLGEGRRIQEQRLPDRHELDDVSTQHKLFVAGGTLASVNTNAFEAANFPPGEEIAGGRIEYDADGSATGILLGRGAIDLVRRRLPRPTPERDKLTLRRFLDDMARRGITTVIEYGSVDHETTFADDYGVYEQVQDEAALPVRCRVAYRINVGASIENEVALLREDDPRSRRQDAMLRVGPMKAFTDGGVLGAYLRDEYADRPGYRGLQLLGEDDLVTLTSYGLEREWQLSLHALGGGAIDAVLAAWQQQAEQVRGRRFSIQHAFDPSDENMRTCSDLGVVVGIHQSLFYMYGPQMLDAWKGNVGDRLNPVRSWRERGVRLAGGSDIAPHDPLIALQSLVTRRTETGEVIGPEEAIATADAVRLFTQDAAYGNFDDALTGSITPGRRADLVLLAECPTEVDPDSLSAIEVIATVTDGRPTYLNTSAPTAFADVGP